MDGKVFKASFVIFLRRHQLLNTVVSVSRYCQSINMHTLQPKHTKLKSEEVKKLLETYNISLAQLPKIKQADPALGEGWNVGDVVKIERKEEDKINVYYRVVA